MNARVSRIAMLLATAAVAGAAAGCGSSSRAGTATTAAHPTATATGSTATSPSPPRAATLAPAGTLGAMPEARSGIAAATFERSVIVSGGLSSAGVSTPTVFVLAAGHPARSTTPLPGPVHDAAATELAGRLLLFGGGQLEGSNRIVAVAPGTPHLIGSLPQSLSDLDAVRIGDRAYVVGGWNGTVTNTSIYAVSPAGRVAAVGRLPLGVRYPAAAALNGRLIVAGGETTSGSPTRRAWSFDPAGGRVARLPDLPAATDHGMAASLGGRVYLLGGLRDGSFTRAILSRAPGETRWRAAGGLPQAIADAGAVAFDGGIAVIGGRDSTGKLAAVTLLRARSLSDSAR